MNVITYRPALFDRRISLWDLGDNHQFHRKREARHDLETIKRWDELGMSYIHSGMFDPERLCTFDTMSEEEFKQIERGHYLIQSPEKITEEQYDDALDCLPPLQYTDGGFLMSEFITGNYTMHYKKIGKQYFRKTVDASDKSTWGWTAPATT